MRVLMSHSNRGHSWQTRMAVTVGGGCGQEPWTRAVRSEWGEALNEVLEMKNKVLSARERRATP